MDYCYYNKRNIDAICAAAILYKYDNKIRFIAIENNKVKIDVKSSKIYVIGLSITDNINTEIIHIEKYNEEVSYTSFIWYHLYKNINMPIGVEMIHTNTTHNLIKLAKPYVLKAHLYYLGIVSIKNLRYDSSIWVNILHPNSCLSLSTIFDTGLNIYNYLNNVGSYE